MTRYAQAHHALMRAVNNPHSSFYRDLYDRHGFDAASITADAASWRQVPMLEKTDIIATPASKRFFLPPEKTETITFTSGTSGKGVVVLPREMSTGDHKGEALFPGASMMVFFYATDMALKTRGSALQHIYSGDGRHLAASATLALQMRADAFLGMPSLLIEFAKHLQPDARERVRYLHFNSDRLSRLQLQVLQELYPSARHSNLYASRELGFIAQAHANDADGPFLLRPFPYLFLELLDASGARPLDGIAEIAEGELVVTKLDEVPFPTIRYKTGDRVRVHPSDQGARIEVLGRAEEERVAIPGGELVLAELERAIIRTFGSKVVDFEGIVREEKRGESMLTSFSITLFAQDGFVLPERASEQLARELRVNRLRTWHDGVVRGMYAPASCVAAKGPAGDGKRKNIIDARR